MGALVLFHGLVLKNVRKQLYGHGVKDAGNCLHSIFLDDLADMVERGRIGSRPPMEP